MLKKEMMHLASMIARASGKDKAVLWVFCEVRFTQYEHLYVAYEAMRIAALTKWLDMKTNQGQTSRRGLFFCNN